MCLSGFALDPSTRATSQIKTTSQFCSSRVSHTAFAPQKNAVLHGSNFNSNDRPTSAPRQSVTAARNPQAQVRTRSVIHSNTKTTRAALSTNNGDEAWKQFQVGATAVTKQVRNFSSAQLWTSRNHSAGTTNAAMAVPMMCLSCHLYPCKFQFKKQDANWSSLTQFQWQQLGGRKNPT